jgi:hypothetical protein
MMNINNHTPIALSFAIISAWRTRAERGLAPGGRKHSGTIEHRGERMKRVPAVVTALAASALAATAIGAATLPAQADQRPVHQVAKQARQAEAVSVISQAQSGQYVSVVTCKGATTPPTITLKTVGASLRVTGTTIKAVTRPKAYHTVYTCTVTVEKKLPVQTGKGGGLKCELGPMGQCHKAVTLNTGFGGKASTVSKHHPAG